LNAIYAVTNVPNLDKMDSDSKKIDMYVNTKSTIPEFAYANYAMAGVLCKLKKMRTVDSHFCFYIFCLKYTKK
jgi:hypothetical protein